MATRAQAKISIARRVDAAASDRLRNVALNFPLDENIICLACLYIKNSIKFWFYVIDFNDQQFTVSCFGHDVDLSRRSTIQQFTWHGRRIDRLQIARYESHGHTLVRMCNNDFRLTYWERL